MRRRRAALALCAFILLASGLKSMQRERERERPARVAVRAQTAAIAAGTEPTAQAGTRMFQRGGNAVDAGVAAMFAASVYEFSHLGFGGEVSLLIRDKTGRVYTIGGVGTMPRKATADFFRNRPLQPGEVQVLEPGGLRGIIPVAGLMPVLVPGMVDAGLVALRETGTVSAADALQPALELADGLIVDEMRAGVIGWSKRFLDLWPGTKSIFMPGERPPVPGEILRQPDLARTIRTMIAAERKALTAGASRQAAIDAVRDVFYRGEIARRIAAFVGANGGLLTYEDMASFRSKPEPAVCGEYRGYAVCKPGFWTQGPVTLQALNILEGFDLRTMGHNSAGYLHTVAEAIKLALADRDTFYADPTVVKVPAERLLSKSYAADRRKLIGPKASHDFRPGSGGTHPSLAETQMVRIDDDLKMRDTTGITASDATGTVFAATPSGAALPTVVAGDTGVPLTQRAQSFFLIPGHPNELAGGKRPRITLSPTLVTRNGKPWLLLSTPGGDNQDQALLQVLLNVAEFGMNMQNAIEAPRFQTRHLVASFDNHAMRRGDLLLDERVAPSVYADLTERGHKTATRSRWNSGAHPVGIRILTNGVMEAGVDPWGYRVAHGW